jgi:predicted nucleic acid-binding protein
MGALSVYLDTCVVVPLFLPDPFVARTKVYLSTNPSDVIVGDFVSAEFASVVGIRLRTGALTIAAAREAFADFYDWVRNYATQVATQNSDVLSAQTMLRRLDLVLRTPDAISLAIARRLGAELATFDIRMADCARALGVPVVAL